MFHQFCQWRFWPQTLLNGFSAEILKSLWPVFGLHVPGPEFFIPFKLAKKVVVEARSFLVQPLDEIEHISAGVVQGDYTRQLMSQILEVKLRTETTNADVERCASMLIYKVDVTLSG